MNCSIEDSQEHVVNSPNMMGGVIGHCVSWLGTCRQVGHRNSPKLLTWGKLYIVRKYSSSVLPLINISSCVAVKIAVFL